MNSSNRKFIWTILILSAALLAAGILSLSLGAISIGPLEVLTAFLGKGTSQQELILYNFRLPAIVLAILVGLGMAASGTILQGITRNELADPGILGINAGSGTAVILYITFFQTAAGSLTTMGAFILPLIAFVGALLTGALIMLLSWKKGMDSIRLILVGIGVNAGLSAIIIAQQLRLEPNDFVKAMVWLSGDLWATQWIYVGALLPWMLLLCVYTLFKAHTLNVLNLGSQVSLSLGISATRERIILLIAAAALAGLGVAAGGGIAFLGLIAPHIARRIVGPKHQRLLPAAALIGALVLVLADAIGKNLLTPTEIPAGLVVAVVSVPYFVILLMKSK
ncbi:FecCD family ABC transporter permease [Peribacillus kribbensis]|uniref:FecCD family ABC transporter permease n=1 Tax=Peribacillus kribbensis TaxID=356658 RepID=UPI0004100B4E|nr:iron ABC transporter permease [Peribacillus kribbensis]